MKRKYVIPIIAVLYDRVATVRPAAFYYSTSQIYWNNSSPVSGVRRSKRQR